MITASIVSYHHRLNELKKVIDCVLAEQVDKLYIVDNSSDDRLRELEGMSDRIRYIHSINRGYGAGHNIAIQEAIELGSTYHVVVNPDIYFEKGVLKKLETYMDASSSVGLVMPRILYPDGELQYLCKLLPSPSDLLFRRFLPWKKYVEKKNRNYELRFTDYNQEMEVPSLSGCFMFIRTSVLKQVRGFDERYFMYAEDLDLCRRIGEVSRTMYYPFVSVFHKYEKGSYKNRKLLKYHICSVVKYFNKWGWFFDFERKKINKRILVTLYKNSDRPKMTFC
ncbi:glycosyltransferase family 2 protein [Parabacteroides goldsteinii]|uniref:glycosyltransferase family 2 protein n=1 Tax=Parabacteroides goldsteinii TaxID=328812 RepID=UPI00241CFBDD|nr:glycosyltransferase family 2 protein [Parabacteroides goldsteinii]